MSPGGGGPLRQPGHRNETPQDHCTHVRWAFRSGAGEAQERG